MWRWGRTAALAGAVAAAAAGAATPAAASVAGPPQLVTRGLSTPWELAPAGDGRVFVTERPGRIRLLQGSTLRRAPLLVGTDLAPEVNKLLGLALHPAFATNRLAYLYVSRRVEGGALRNGIWRLRLRADGSRFDVDRQVLDGIDSDGNHDGGRMAFGPDGDLYVTTGDIHQPSRPQDLQSLNGKVLRFTAPGDEDQLGVPADNPFVAQGGNARYVWSYGHRHPQGLAFDAAGRLWETEHGPTGEQHGELYPGGNGKTGRDELNLIVRGGDYGWPLVSGDMTGPGLIPPVAHAADAPSWAPGDLAVGRDGELYAPFLAGTQLHELDVTGDRLDGQSSPVTTLGRLRLAVADGDGLLIAQDGEDAGIYRVPLTAPPAPPPAGTTATAPPAATPPPAASTPVVPAPAPAVPGETAEDAEESYRDTIARQLTYALGVELRRAGVLAGRRATTLVGGYVGTTRVELRLGTRRGRLLMRSTYHVRTRSAQRYAVRADRAARRLVRARTRPRLVVVVRTAGGSNALSAVLARRSGG